MPFQLRNFSFQKDQNIEVKSNILDLYVYKANNTCVGVKFRDAQQKQYGYKIRCVQVKVYGEQLNENKIKNPHLQLYQNWKKFQIDFKYKLFLPHFYQNKNLFEKQIIKQKQHQEQMKQKVKHKINQKQDLIISKLQSFESQLVHMNLQLKKCIQAHFKVKQEKYNRIFQWASSNNSILQIFQIKKDKYKSPNYQKGVVSVKPIKNNLKLKDEKCKNLIFKTLCFQNKSKQVIQNSIEHSKDPIDLSFNKIYNQNSNHENKLKFQWNCSYPQLLQDIYEEYITKQGKF